MQTASIPQSAVSSDEHAASTLRIFAMLSDGFKNGFRVRLWNGQTWQHDAGPACFTLVLKHAGALRAMFWPKDWAALGESYVFDDYDIEGDIVVFADWFAYLAEQLQGRAFHDRLPTLWELGRLPDHKNPRDPSKVRRPAASDRSQAEDRDAISFTYDLPGEFYRLFLDKNMQYTCGYFASPDETVDDAQTRKLDHICKKLRLKPGERFVDFGCGWGGLVIHAAKHYGVHATGVTLAGEQAKWCERAIDEAGLRSRVQIVYSDYRDFQMPGQFDKASSVGMSEHIGVKNLPVFLGKIFESLRPGGVYLHHCITVRPNTPPPYWMAFVDRYVFPNGELQTLLQIVESAIATGFEVRDVENLREHYVFTLENWVKRLEANRDAVVKIVGEVTYRIFRVYMAGSTICFKSGVHMLNQTLLSKPDRGSAHLPLTRADWYA